MKLTCYFIVSSSLCRVGYPCEEVYICAVELRHDCCGEGSQEDAFTTFQDNCQQEATANNDIANLSTAVMRYVADLTLWQAVMGIIHVQCTLQTPRIFFCFACEKVVLYCTFLTEHF